MRGDGGEDVPAVEGVAHLAQPEARRVGEVQPPGHGSLLLVDVGEQAVVGADQHTGTTRNFHSDTTPRRTHTGVDHREYHTLGHPRDGSGQSQRTSSHITWCDAVGQIDNGGLRCKITNNRVHHTDEFIVEAIVGQERDGVVAARHPSDANAASTAARACSSAVGK